MVLAVIYLAFISLGLPDSLLGSGWPVMWGVFGVPQHYAGFISIVVTGGTVVSSLASTKAIARFGTAKVVAFSVLMTSLALGGFSFSRHFVFLLLLALPLGLGGGAIDAALNNFVALHYKAAHMNFLHCCWGVGASLSPLIVSFWLARGGAWRLGYRTVSVIQLCLAVIMFLSFPLWKKVGGTSEIAENKETEAKTASHGIIETLGIRGVKAAVLSFFAYCAFETTAGLWGPSFLVVIKGLEPQTAARWVSSYYAGIMLGRFLSGLFSGRLSTGTLLKIGCAGIFLSIITLSMPFALYLAGFFILGLGCAPIFPALMHDTPLNFGNAYSQSVVGLQMAGAYLGATTMPALVGKIASLFSFRLFVPAIAAFFALMLAAVLCLRRSVKKSHVL